MMVMGERDGDGMGVSRLGEWGSVVDWGVCECIGGVCVCVLGVGEVIIEWEDEKEGGGGGAAAAHRDEDVVDALVGVMAVACLDVEVHTMKELVKVGVGVGGVRGVVGGDGAGCAQSGEGGVGDVLLDMFVAVGLGLLVVVVDSLADRAACWALLAAVVLRVR